MRIEMPSNDPALISATETVGFPLYDQSESNNGTIVLHEAHRFTVVSVIGAIEAAVNRARTAAEQNGDEFDRQSWQPNDADVEEIRQQHRPHMRYLRGVAGLASYVAQIRSHETEFDVDPYDFQVETLDRLAGYLRDNDPFAHSTPGAYGDISGGGGKSRIIAMLTDGFTSQEDPSDPIRVLVTAPSRAILDELAGTDGSSGFGQYAPHIKPDMLNQDSKDYDAKVLLATNASVLAWLKRDPHALENFDLIVGDEAHTLLGPETSRNIAQVRRQVIGFTGSSIYSEEKHVGMLLPHRLIKVDTSTLIEDERVAPMQFWVCKTGQVIYQDDQTGDYSEAELKRISNLERRHQIAAEIGDTFVRAGHYGAYACNTIAEANKFAADLNGRAIDMPDGSQRVLRVAAVHGKTKNPHAFFRQLEHGELDAVTVVDIDTGWNVHRLSYLVNLRPTGSIVKAAQRMLRTGRLLYDEDNRLIASQIVDLADIVVSAKMKNPSDAERRNARYILKQVLAPSLIGFPFYVAGATAKSTKSTDIREIDLDDFPRHLRWPMHMANGMPIARVLSLGAGVIRGEGVGENFTPIEAARGLGTTLSRLGVLMAASGVNLRDGQLRAADIDKVAARMLATNEPLVL